MAARHSLKRWFPTEVYPILGIVGVACGGATYYLYRLSQGSEVVWDRKGDWKPWDKVKYDQNQKLFSVNKGFWEERKQKRIEMESAGRIVDQI